MISGFMFRHRLEVLRAAVAVPGSVDDWNHPTYAASTVALTVPGQVQPLTMEEVALLTDAGATIGDFRAYTPPSGIVAGDKLRRVDTGEVFDVRSVIDAAGIGRHMELLLHKVVD